MSRVFRSSRIVFSLGALFCLAAAADLAASDYAVVVSKRTQADPQWKAVVDALVAKHKAEVITYEKDVMESLEPLRKMFPTYACFVAQPEEAGRNFVVTLHRMTRKLDDDPYTDVRWGILTGYDAQNALRIAKISAPLVIRKGAAGAGLNLNLFEEGIAFHEGSMDQCTEKKRGGKPEMRKDPNPPAKSIADMLNNFQPDLFGTSGHATDRDWQIGFPTKESPNRKGQFRCKDGVLFGMDVTGKQYPVHSPNPKVYLPWGNCLMGLIRDKQSIALAWMGSAGVDQMYGYVVPSWYGRAGWGTQGFFFSEPGRYTLSDAFYFVNQSIVHDLITRFPKSADANYPRWNIEEDPTIIGRMALKLGYTKDTPGMKDNLGLLWDRDTLAFYGDPAWEARLAPRDLPFTKELTSSGGVYTFRLRAGEDCTIGMTAMFLPKRVKDIEITAGKEFSPLVTSKFIMVMKPGKLEKGKTCEVVFKAKEI